MLRALGWDDHWQATWDGRVRGKASPARVTRIDKGGLTVESELGQPRLAVAAVRARACAVGDWVGVDPDSDRIEFILDRRTRFARRAPGTSRSQPGMSARVIAANMDTVFVLVPIDAGINANRLTRELVLAFESGANVEVIVTKVDLVSATELGEGLARTRLVAPEVAVWPISNRDGAGIDALRSRLVPGQTIALLGASGSGKSSLVNTLAGHTVQLTSETRANDRRGRHRTTAGQLVALADGALLIDTPGIRSVGLWESETGMERAFADLSQYVQSCRFENCTHTSEPGCGLIAAVDAGDVDRERWEMWKELCAEVEDLEDRLVVVERNRQRDVDQRARARASRRRGHD